MSRIWAKVIAVGVLGAPLVWLAYLISQEVTAPTSALGADPGEAMLHYLGEWGMRACLLAFSITPLARLTHQPLIARQRRIAGLFAFSYVVLHLLAYAYFYLEFDFGLLAQELIERPYITVGFAAFLCLLPMALTSTSGWQRRLRRKWLYLHRLIYPALLLGLIHLWWLIRDGYAEAVIYSVWFALLVGYRLRRQWHHRAA